MKFFKPIILVILFMITVPGVAQTVAADSNFNISIVKLDAEQLNNESRLLRFSIVTGFLEGIKPVKKEFGITMGVFNDPKTGTSRVSILNQSIQDLLALGINPGRILFQVKDRSKYSYDPKYGDEKKWLSKNSFCYELTLPTGTFPISNLFEFIRRDIASQFNLNITREKRMADNLHRYGLKENELNREVELFIVTEIY